MTTGATGPSHRPSVGFRAVKLVVVVLSVALALAACTNGGDDTVAPSTSSATVTTVTPSRPSTATIPLPTGSPSPTGSTTPGDAATVVEPTTTTSTPVRTTAFEVDVSWAVSSELVDDVPARSIPESDSCEGDDRSPAVTFRGVPDGTVELALVLTDLDAAPGLVHWIVVGIPPTTIEVAAGETPAGAVTMTNDFGDAAYVGPCPPAGERHRYVLTALALAEPSDLVEGMPGTDAASALYLIPTFGGVELLGVYER